MKNLTSLDYLTIPFSLGPLSEIQKNCGQLLQCHSKFEKLDGAQVHRGTVLENDENFGAEFTECHRALILTHANREKSLKNAILRAQMIEKIYSYICSKDGPIAWSATDFEQKNSSACQQKQKEINSLRSKKQKEFTSSAMTMLAPFFGGEKVLDEILYDLLCAALNAIYGKRWSLRFRSGKKFFYSNWAELLIDDMPAGLIAYDAANGGGMISISGAGCAATNFKRVYSLLTRKSLSVFNPKISRCDIALDDLSGQIFNYESVKAMTLEGMFTPARGAAPRYSCVESGHVVAGRFNKITRELETHIKLDFFPDLGCSLYIGSRDAGKLVRVYEKGIQMKSLRFLRWCRFELELRAVDRVLPFEILIESDKFFAGSSRAAAACLAAVADSQNVEHCETISIRTFREKVSCSVEHVKKYARMQCARVVTFMREAEKLSDKQIVDFFVSYLDERDDDRRIPSRLALPVPRAFLLPHRGPEPKNRPGAGDTNPVLNETKNLNDFLATVA